MSDQKTDLNEAEHDEAVQLMEMVDALSDETKDLALNLALYLAKTKKSSEQLQRMEPEFVRLVNSTMKVIQELTVILNAARHREKMIYQPPSGRAGRDHIQVRLESVVSQCNQILESLNQVRGLIA